ncbi:MAG: alpha/beta hydrolase [Planctomycetales bacterium]|nr:alpha/beta hydrolase [Planctomycetales bacterium]
MLRPILVFCLLGLMTLGLDAAEMMVRRDIAYCQPTNERQLLDIYSPSAGQDHPIIVWIHGGGWTKGNKTSVQNKPRAFTERGFVFVSTNYRFAPVVGVKEMVGDVAKAIRWAHDHAKEFGGDPNSVYVMGHSAGAHLAALVCTDDRYLTAEGLSLSIIKGCVPVDVSVYDIPKRIRDSGATAPPPGLEAIFGDSEESHQDLSPVTHITKGKNIPPFLILHVADRPETKTQSQWLAEKLEGASVWAEVVAAEGKTHGTINTELGLSEDKPTQSLFKFLAEDHRKP